MRAAIRGLEGLGCRVRPVRLPHTRYAVADVLRPRDGRGLVQPRPLRRGALRPPRRSERALRRGKRDLSAMYAETRSAGFGREVKRRIMLGTYVLSAGYYDAYYLRAQRVRTLIRKDFDDAFAEVDVIAAPVSPVVAFKLGEKLDDPLAMYLADVYTLPASLAGRPRDVACPAASRRRPRAATPLPVGLQLIAPALAEERLCSVGAAWERIAPPPPRAPPSAP